MSNLNFSRFLNAIAELQSNGIDVWKGESFTVQRIYGGSNNALYKIESEFESIACKLCVDDRRNRAVREFGALEAIQEAGFNIAPKPLLLDQSRSIVQYPAVFYRWVDWEYSGWGDPALDIAELRWHAALQPLSQEEHQWLRASYKAPFTDPEFSGRLRIWDHILATRWPFLILRVLWSNHNGPDRVRLSRIVTPSDQLLKRLVYYIELAENLFSGAEHVPSWR